MRESKPNESWPVHDLVDAVAIEGSDYPGVVRRGARVALEIETVTGLVVVTRGGGAVRIGYVRGRYEKTIARQLRDGHWQFAEIVDIVIGPYGKMFKLRLERLGS